jgi:predicted DNA-binding protein (UPF0251 family)
VTRGVDAAPSSIAAAVALGWGISVFSVLMDAAPISGSCVASRLSHLSSYMTDQPSINPDRSSLAGASQSADRGRVRSARRQTALRYRLGLERAVRPEVTVADSGLAQALATLSTEDREALMLIAWEGLDHRRAAVVMGCSARAFSMRLHRARRRLTAAMAAVDQCCSDPMEAMR